MGGSLSFLLSFLQKNIRHTGYRLLIFEPSKKPEAMSFSQKFQFYHDGFIVVQNSVPSAACENALKLITEQLRLQNLKDNFTWETASKILESGCFSRSDFREGGDFQFRCHLPTYLVTATSAHPTLLDLVNCTDVKKFVFSLLRKPVGEDDAKTFLKAIISQIAVRFPGSLFGRRHIDGIDRGEHSPFDLLVGVALTDQNEADNGNLCVWPGSHKKIQEAINNLHLPAKPPSLADIEPLSLKLRSLIDNIDIGEPSQVKLNAGDVILAHQKLVHSGGRNDSKSMRLMVYFRMKWLNLNKDIEN